MAIVHASSLPNVRKSRAKWIEERAKNMTKTSEKSIEQAIEETIAEKLPKRASIEPKMIENPKILKNNKKSWRRYLPKIKVS